MNVGIYIFNDVEVLDFAGPFEVFSVTGRRDGSNPFTLYLIAETLELVRARGDFRVQPHFTFENHPPLEVLVVPGGGGFRPDGTPYGTRLEKSNPRVLEWLRQTAPSTPTVLSVCSGALIVARAGLTHGLRVTTHQGALKELEGDDPSATLCPTERVVDNGQFVFTGGVSAGMDGALEVVSKLRGRDAALETARYMEYDWRGR